MPTPKPSTKPKTGAASPAAPTSAAPETDTTKAQVIADLIRGGMTYAQAVAAVGGEAQQPSTTAPAYAELVEDAPEPIDPGEHLPVIEVSHAPREGYAVAEELYELREKISRMRKKHLFTFTVTLDERTMDWVLHASLQEAAMRGRADLTLSDYIAIRLKELKAADPTHGGRRNPSKSGPKDQYNPATGNWQG